MVVFALDAGPPRATPGMIVHRPATAARVKSVDCLLLIMVGTLEVGKAPKDGDGTPDMETGGPPVVRGTDLRARWKPPHYGVLPWPPWRSARWPLSELASYEPSCTRSRPQQEAQAASGSTEAAMLLSTFEDRRRRWLRVKRPFSSDELARERRQRLHIVAALKGRRVGAILLAHAALELLDRLVLLFLHPVP